MEDPNRATADSEKTDIAHDAPNHAALAGHLRTKDVPDLERQEVPELKDADPRKKSAFKSLGLLDRFLALWILLAMVIGVLLGNFVDQVGPALQKGKFVGVSAPIGMFSLHPLDSSTPLRLLWLRQENILLT
jgi:hypothetical protein